MNPDARINNPELDQITEKVIGCIFKVSNTLGAGFLEKLYENACAIEVAKIGLGVRQQYPIEVSYDGTVIGQFTADMLVAEQVLVEFKTVRALEDVHVAQGLNYLRATGLPICLLVNFYRPKVEVKRLVASAAWLRR